MGFWGPLIAAEPPEPRSWHSAIYDPIADAMIVFGGWSSAYYDSMNDSWALSFRANRWTRLEVSGVVPPRRAGHVAVYDSARHRMILHGGSNWWTTWYRDVWALDLTTHEWTLLETTGGPTWDRFAHGGIYDPVRDRLVVFGGKCGSPWGSWLGNDVWALDLATLQWSNVTPAGGPPSPRLSLAFYDAVADRMIVAEHAMDAWALDFASSSWVALNSPPFAFGDVGGAYDADSRRIVWVNENWSTAGPNEDRVILYEAESNLWPDHIIAGVRPQIATGGRASAIYDPIGARVVAFGGGTGLSSDVNETRTLTLEEGGERLLGWWPADGDARDRVDGSDGALVGGAGFGMGRVCQAFDLNGVQAYVNLGTAPAFDVRDRDFTVALWARWRSLEGEQVLIEKWDNDPFRGWTLTKLVSNVLRFACGRAGQERRLDAAPPDIETGRWFHVALTRTSNEVRMFWDGTELGRTPIAACDPTSFPLLLGRRSDNRGFYHNGWLDEVRFYGRALSLGEIQNLAAQTTSDLDADGLCDGADNCPEVGNPDQADLDADGHGDLCDCAEESPGASESPPEVSSLEWPADDRVLAWPALSRRAGPATTYDVLRGALGELPVGSGLSEACMASRYARTALEEVAAPNPGRGFWYLVRGRNECGIGSYGTASDGSPRMSGSCP